MRSGGGGREGGREHLKLSIITDQQQIARMESDQCVCERRACAGPKSMCTNVRYIGMFVCRIVRVFLCDCVSIHPCVCV